MFLPENFNIENFVVGLLVIIISISVHEFGHAISADRLGDPGPRRDGRITLMPDKHFDPAGFLMIVFTMIAGFGLGWGKPVVVDSRYFKNPRRDMLIVAAAGPAMNLIIAVIAAVVARLLAPSRGGMEFLFGDALSSKFLLTFLFSNLALMFFNLIPVHPLDGGKILSGLLPPPQSRNFDRVMWKWGPIALVASCFIGRGLIGYLIGPPVNATAALLLGVRF